MSVGSCSNIDRPSIASTWHFQLNITGEYIFLADKLSVVCSPDGFLLTFVVAVQSSVQSLTANFQVKEVYVVVVFLYSPPPQWFRYGRCVMQDQIVNYCT